MMKICLIFIYISMIFIPLRTFSSSNTTVIKKYGYSDCGHKSIKKLYDYFLCGNDPDKFQTLHLKVLKTSIFSRLNEHENAHKEIYDIQRMIIDDYELYKEFIDTYY